MESYEFYGIIFFFLMTIGLSLYNMYSLTDLHNQIIEQQNIKVYTEGIYESNASGVYFPGCGFFVDTRGRRIDEINTTFIHESAHAFVQQYENKSHFCD